MFVIRRVVGRSMLPTFAEGTILIGVKYRRPKIDDVVIAKSSSTREIVKRIRRITADGYFLVGDNERESTDSRSLGYFSPDTIKAVVVGRIGYGN